MGRGGRAYFERNYAWDVVMAKYERLLARGRRADARASSFVIQRYGLEVAGGSELHCRWLATRLARRHQVEIATTCALDYIEWRNHYPPGDDTVDGIRVRRFPVARPRSQHRFSLVQDLVFHDEHTLDDEREWVVENGPVCPALVKALPSWPADARRLLFVPLLPELLRPAGGARTARCWCRPPRRTRRSSCPCSARSSARRAACST